jgi:glycerol-3-phosphate dehydrogenase (NAD(P)+)
MKETILVIGAGSWGTAIAQTIAGYDHTVMIWDSNDAVLEEIQYCHHTNKRYHPNLKLSENIEIATSLEDACLRSTAIILVDSNFLYSALP